MALVVPRAERKMLGLGDSDLRAEGHFELSASTTGWRLGVDDDDGRSRRAIA